MVSLSLKLAKSGASATALWDAYWIGVAAHNFTINGCQEAPCLPLSKSHTNSAMSLGGIARLALAAQGLGWCLEGHIPDIARILADGAVGGEPRHMGNVLHAHPRPIGRRQPELVDAALGRDVVVKVCGYHVIVVMAQGVHQRREAPTFTRPEYAGVDSFYDLPQHGGG